mmetsp:Transcript_23201/g.54719  ORF Transcript_23201/g.54719 Transcript_23201/m.54719 type:complete len:208 (-) Transcript_23201:2287-2910(-)
MPHHLDRYLETALPALGLDAETYGPYLTGSDEGDVELDDIIELFQASSESHSDDDEAWTKFKHDIIGRRREFLSAENERREQEASNIKKKKAEELQKEIDASQQNAVELEARKIALLETAKLENMPAEKAALMAKFGYEDDGEGSTQKVPTNKDHAVAVNLANAQKARNLNKTTKLEEQKKTKAAKQSRDEKKEQRRMKSTKHERKR